MDGGTIRAMARNRIQQATPDLFSTASAPLGGTSAPSTKQVSSMSDQEQRHILPKDLPAAVKHLTDRDLNLLIAASLEEAKRRGRTPPSVQAEERVPKRSAGTEKGWQREAATPSLTWGQINAVRAAFKAGVKPSLIARQFCLSQSDVRKVLASNAEK
jgi:hypothetical protein